MTRTLRSPKNTICWRQQHHLIQARSQRLLHVTSLKSIRNLDNLEYSYNIISGNQSSNMASPINPPCIENTAIFSVQNVEGCLLSYYCMKRLKRQMAWTRAIMKPAIFVPISWQRRLLLATLTRCWSHAGGRVLHLLYTIRSYLWKNISWSLRNCHTVIELRLIALCYNTSSERGHGYDRTQKEQSRICFSCTRTR